jgi:hypothetical protein
MNPVYQQKGFGQLSTDRPHDRSYNRVKLRRNRKSGSGIQK